MRKLPAILLRHQRRHDTHHDLLIHSPHHPANHPAPLYAWRINASTRAWPQTGSFLLHQLPPHRSRYLNYQGPLTNARGTVTITDRGYCLPMLWTPHRIILHAHFTYYHGSLELKRLTPTTWTAAIAPNNIQHHPK